MGRRLSGELFRKGYRSAGTRARMYLPKLIKSLCLSFLLVVGCLGFMNPLPSNSAEVFLEKHRLTIALPPENDPHGHSVSGYVIFSAPPTSAWIEEIRADGRRIKGDNAWLEITHELNGSRYTINVSTSGERDSYSFVVVGILIK